MSYQKLSLPLSLGTSRKRNWLWIWCGVGVLLLAVIAFVVFHGEEDLNVVTGRALDMETFGAQEWPENIPLSRQTLESDDVSKSPDMPDSESEPVDDLFLIRGRVTRNQTLFVALKNHGLDIDDVQQVLASLEGVVDFKKSRPGDRYEVHLDVDRRILKFVYESSPEDISVSVREGNVFVGQKVAILREVVQKRLSGVVTDTLYQAFVNLGESGELASHFMQLFKYDMDFSTGTQRGDEFTMLVEKVYLNGQFYKYGRVWAATYETVSGRRLEAYYFDAPEEDYKGYYDDEGRALKRTFLKTPVVGCPLTSPYNLKRMHPILKRVRPHYGMDWACPTGTPIMSFGDGTVTFADWKGGNGNLLVIEHPNGYTSLYAHLYAFGRGIKKGVRVHQGQVVGLVGNTGISTGPHLHFGLKLHGKYIDPSSVDTRRAYTLSGSRLSAFHSSRDKIRRSLWETGGSGSALVSK